MPFFSDIYDLLTFKPLLQTRDGEDDATQSMISHIIRPHLDPSGANYGDTGRRASLS
jgi:hypothetical protein